MVAGRSGSELPVIRSCIHNRADCCMERLSKFYVFVADHDMRERTLSELLADASVARIYHEQVAPVNGPALQLPATGRFVRIQKTEPGYLSLAEVKVYGVNLAQGKDTAQSSTYPNAPAHLAVDGDTNRDFNAGSVANTNLENEPWWQVDLGEQLEIGRIKLTNRTDCCNERLSHFYVLVSETDMRGRSLASLVNDPDVWKSFEVAGVDAEYLVTGHSRGRYVRVQRNATGYMQLAEVVVYGAPVTANSDYKPNPGLYGEWSPAIEWPHLAVHAGLLPSGKILTYDATPDDFEPVLNPVASPNDTTRASIWDYRTGVHVDAANNTGDDLFCSGQVQMADGNIFIAGGTTGYNAPIVSTNVFEFATESWRSGPKMQYGRWYPTVTNMGNGELLIAGGGGRHPEIYSPATNSLRTLGGVPANTTRTAWPFIMQAPNGRMLFAGGAHQRNISFLETEGEGKLIPTSSTTIDRNRGSFVVYDHGSMLVTGGHHDMRMATKFNMDTASNTETKLMQLPRKDHNSLVLPDGTVILIGGTNDSGSAFCNDEKASYAPEIWNPASGNWTLMAAQQYPRQYHSTAVLLPDGRVWSGGQGYATIVSNQRALCSYQNNAEIFSPPYLFNADGTPASRPVIQAVAENIKFGASLDLITPQASTIGKANLIRLSTTTHATNFSQRLVPLAFTQMGTDRLTLNLPDNPNAAPAGYYMLFIVNHQGTPSEAKIVKLGDIQDSFMPDINDLGPVITASQTEPQLTNATATFTAQASGLGVLTYSWNFGDGSAPTAFSVNHSTVSHVFSRPGRFNVTVTVEDASGITRQHTFTQIVHAPLVQADARTSSGIIEHEAYRQVWSVNPDNNTVAIIDRDSQTLIAELKTGSRPTSLGIAPDGNVWVVNKQSASITVINPLTLQQIKKLTLPIGSAPHGLVFNATAAIIALEDLQQIRLLNPTWMHWQPM